MIRSRILQMLVAGSGCTALLIAAPAVRAQEGPQAASALRAAEEAKSAAAAAQAAAAAARPAPATVLVPAATVLTAPPPPTATPVLTFAAAPADAAQDLMGSAEAMPVASAKLLAALRSEPAAVPVAVPDAAPAVPLAPPPAPIATPTFAPRLLPPAAPLIAPPRPSNSYADSACSVTSMPSTSASREMRNPMVLWITKPSTSAITNEYASTEKAPSACVPSSDQPPP